MGKETETESKSKRKSESKSKRETDRERICAYMKLIRHPIAFFCVPLTVVVRREMGVVVSCGMLRVMQGG